METGVVRCVWHFGGADEQPALATLRELGPVLLEGLEQLLGENRVAWGLPRSRGLTLSLLLTQEDGLYLIRLEHRLLFLRLLFFGGLLSFLFFCNLCLLLL